MTDSFLLLKIGIFSQYKPLGDFTPDYCEQDPATLLNFVWTPDDTVAADYCEQDTTGLADFTSDPEP